MQAEEHHSIRLEIDAEGETIVGTVSEGDGPEHAFHGRVAMMAAIDGLLEAEGPGAGTGAGASSNPNGNADETR